MTVAANKRDRLTSDGFELYSSMPVGLPHFIWRCDLDLIHDRNLALSEETILRLIDAGVSDRTKLSLLMGVDESVLRNGVINLLENNALEYDSEGALRLSSVGKRVLLHAKVRLTSTVENVNLRHDPYSDSFRWHRPEHSLSAKQLRAANLKMISAVPPLEPPVVEERYRDIQALIDSDGLPTKEGQPAKSAPFVGKREILQLRALSVQTAYSRAELEVWVRQQDRKFGWRILRNGTEEAGIAAYLERLEAEGAQIIPSDHPMPEADATPITELLNRAAEELVSEAQLHNGITFLDTLQLREAIGQATRDAKRELIIISPWLNRGAIDQEMTRWFSEALANAASLRIIIGYGIERLPEQPMDSKGRRTFQALDHLRRLSSKFQDRIELHEIGNTHEKILVVDADYAIVGSFNFLSFNPNIDRGPGVRRETGTKVTVRAAVEELLLSRVRPALGQRPSPSATEASPN